jgi:hypothetical protein
MHVAEDLQIHERAPSPRPRSSHQHPRRRRQRPCRNLPHPTPARPILHTDADGTAHLHDTRNPSLLSDNYPANSHRLIKKRPVSRQ